MDQSEKTFMRWLLGGILAFIGFIGFIWSLTIIPEGHVGVYKEWGKAIPEKQFSPGLHFKVPIMVSIEKIEVRQRKNVEDLSAASQDQLQLTATTSINWTVHADQASDLFIQYGGLTQFENRILDPKLKSAAKAALAKFPAHVLIQERQKAVDEIMRLMVEQMEPFPVTMNSPQLEDVVPPESYRKAVEQKEIARQDAVREQHKLEQQRLESLQKVNTAEAEATSKRLAADAEAYRVTVEAEAEAEAIRVVNEQLEKSADYVELVKAKAWDGVLPVTTVGGGDAVPLLNLGGK